MPQWIISLLESNYDEQHGVVNSRPVVDALIRDSKQPFRDLSSTFQGAPRQWQLPLVEAMRTMAATGYCTAEEAGFVFDATRAVAEDPASEEYIKTVNAVGSARVAATAVVTFALSLLNNANESQRRLAFYAVALLVEKRTAEVPQQLRAQLKIEADRETSPARRDQFLDVLARL
jgi:hypothetical protein